MTEPVTPSASYMDWIENAAGAAAAVVENLSTWETFSFLGIAACGLAVVARVAKNIPGWGGMVSWAAEKVSDWVAPDKKAEAKKKAQVIEDSAWGIIQRIEDLPPENPVVQQLKKAISDGTPAMFNGYFDEWKKARPQPPQVAKEVDSNDDLQQG